MTKKDKNIFIVVVIIATCSMVISTVFGLMFIFIYNMPLYVLHICWILSPLMVVGLLLLMKIIPCALARNLMMFYSSKSIRNHRLIRKATFVLSMNIAILFIMAISLTGCGETNSSQQPSSWETQLGFAQKKARAVVPDVVLENVMVSSLPFKPPPEKSAHQVHFTFLNTAGNTVDVSFVNTRMEKTVFIGESIRIQPLPSEEELEWREDIISTIKIGTEEAIERTSTEGETFADEREHVNVELNLSLYSNEEEQQTYGHAAVWLVTYWEPLRGPCHDRLSILLDAQTGEIIHSSVTQLPFEECQ